MKVDAVAFSFAGDKYLGRSYDEMDCQAFVERCMKDCGLPMDLGGSNSWYREIMKHGWVGTPEECMAKYGQIPKGALVFIWEPVSASTPEKFRHDGVGDLTHMGIVIHRHDGAIHSSHSRGGVCYSKFKNKSINGGWNRIGLYDKFDYSFPVTPSGDDEDTPPEVIVLQGKVVAPKGSTVKLRQKPSSDCKLYWDIPLGTEVMVTDYGPEWSKVITGGLTGWMMTKFIEIQGEVKPGEDEPVDSGQTDIDDDSGIDPDTPDSTVTLKLSADDAAAAYQFLKAILKQIEQQVGRG
jgi:hypothetical protein